MRLSYLILAYISFNLCNAQIVKEKVYTTYENKKKWVSMIETFDPEGHLLNRTRYLMGVSNYRTSTEIFKYNAAGQRVMDSGYSVSNAGKTTQEYYRTYEFNEFGLVSIYTDWENEAIGKPQTACPVNYYYRMRYSYFNDKKLRSYQQFLDCPDSMYVFERKKIIYGPNGKLQEEISYGSDTNKVKSRLLYFYNNSDSLIREEFYIHNADSLELGNVWEHAYDDAGRRVFYRNTAFKLYHIRAQQELLNTHYAYNKKGQLKEEIITAGNRQREIKKYYYRNEKVRKIKYLECLYISGPGTKKTEKIKYVYF